MYLPTGTFVCGRSRHRLSIHHLLFFHVYTPFLALLFTYLLSNYYGEIPRYTFLSPLEPGISASQIPAHCLATVSGGSSLASL